MKKTKFAIAVLAASTASFALSSPLQAQFRGLGNRIKQAQEAVEDVTNNAQSARGAASGSASSGQGGRAGPPSADYTSRTSCGNFSIQNAFIGQYGDYTFSSGLNTEERSGIINREPVTPSNGCFMPSMKTYDVLYIEVPTRQLEGMSGGYEMQCINTSTGQQAHDEARPRWYNTRGKDIMLHTGHSLGYTPTASGSNSDRSAAWEADLKRRGMTMFGFNMPPLHTDSGTDFYCQYYNKSTGKSVVAFQYRRSAG